MARKKRSDSIEAAVEAAAAAANPIHPPAHLRLPDECLPFWFDIINTRNKQSWTPNDLVIAAQLARAEFDLCKYSSQLATYGRFTEEGETAKMPNALHKVVNDLTGQVQALSRSLQVHARATQGESRDQKAKNALYANARNKAAPEDDLLAKPRH
jgi:hypothetical protein